MLGIDWGLFKIIEQSFKSFGGKEKPPDASRTKRLAKK